MWSGNSRRIPLIRYVHWYWPAGEGGSAACSNLTRRDRMSPDTVTALVRAAGVSYYDHTDAAIHVGPIKLARVA